MLNRAYTQRRQEQVRKIRKIDLEVKNFQDKAYTDCLQEMATMTGEPIEMLRSHFDYERLLAEKTLKDPNPSAAHDPNMPATSYQEWQTIMTSEGINPKSTAMQYEPNTKKGLTLASASGLLFRQSHLLVTPIITEHPILSEASPEIQEFTRRHECHHLKLQHTSMKVIADTLNPKNNPKQLISAQEKEANIHAASANSRSACSGAFIQCFMGNTGIIDEDNHCKDMLRMCTLMKRKEELLS